MLLPLRVSYLGSVLQTVFSVSDLSSVGYTSDEHNYKKLDRAPNSRMDFEN